MPKMSQPPPNNPLKLPIYLVLWVLLVVLIVKEATGEASWAWLVWFAACLVLNSFAIREVLLGRNPWWTRALIDRHPKRDDAD